MYMELIQCKKCSNNVVKRERKNIILHFFLLMRERGREREAKNKKQQKVIWVTTRVMGIVMTS